MSSRSVRMAEAASLPMSDASRTDPRHLAGVAAHRRMTGRLQRRRQPKLRRLDQARDDAGCPCDRRRPATTTSVMAVDRYVDEAVRS